MGAVGLIWITRPERFQQTPVRTSGDGSFSDVTQRELLTCKGRPLFTFFESFLHDFIQHLRSAGHQVFIGEQFTSSYHFENSR